MNHSFNVELAKKYGIEEAILIENLAFWIKRNKANNIHKIDGHYWTYNSARAFEELFPYMNLKKIQRSLSKLEDNGVIISAVYNKQQYDRTKWYAIVDKDILSMYGIDENPCNCSLDILSNGFTQNVQPIPDIKPDINKIKNHEHDMSSFENFFKTISINFTKTNQASVKKLMKCMSAKEVLEYLTETHKNLSENPAVKNIAGTFTKLISEGKRQPAYKAQETNEHQKCDTSINRQDKSILSALDNAIALYETIKDKNEALRGFKYATKKFNNELVAKYIKKLEEYIENNSK